MCDLLAELELRRETGQTQREFAVQAAAVLSPAKSELTASPPDKTTGAGWDSSKDTLYYLVDRFYELRFGGQHALSASQRTRVGDALNELSQRIHASNAISP